MGRHGLGVQVKAERSDSDPFLTCVIIRSLYASLSPETSDLLSLPA